MPLALGLGSIAAPIVGGIVGKIAGSGDQDAALQLQKQALQNIMNVNTPDAQAMRIELEKYVSAGQLSPTMEQTIQQNPSLMQNIQVDPRLKQAQMSALGSLQQMGQTGLSNSDKSTLAQINNQAAQQAQAAQASALQNMQQRGESGAGSELASDLSSSQGAANRANAQGLSLAGQSQQNALNAIMGAGNLGSQMQGQNFAEDAQKAQAQDVINRYNAMNAQQVTGQNTAVGNAAQSQNLSNKQNLMNSNTQLGNQQTMYNAQLPQQVYQDQMQKASAAANAQGTMANNYNNKASQTQQMYGGIGQGVGQGLTGAATYMNNANNQATQNNFNQQYLDILKNKTQPSYAYGSADNGTVNPNSPTAGLMSHGGLVEGKEEVPGDSPENDTVPVHLSPGEMIIPKSIVQEKNADVVHAFIRGVLAAHGNKSK